MSNCNNQSMPDGDHEWDEFELQLRAQSLGPRPQRRDEILYQCGYAAGVAASLKRRRASILRWQVVSVAASLLACVALASHYLTIASIHDAQQAVLRNEGTQDQSNVIDSEQSSDTWVALLTRDRSLDSQRRDKARTVGTSLSDLEVDELEGVFFPMSQDSNGTTLQPRDFPLFLQGEV